jgi:hypothetical protein
MHVAVDANGSDLLDRLNAWLASAYDRSTSQATSDQHVQRLQQSSNSGDESRIAEPTGNGFGMSPQERDPMPHNMWGVVEQLSSHSQWQSSIRKSNRGIWLPGPHRSGNEPQRSEDAPEVLSFPKLAEQVKVDDLTSGNISSLNATWVSSRRRWHSHSTTALENDGNVSPILSEVAVLLQEMGSAVEETCAHWKSFASPAVPYYAVTPMLQCPVHRQAGKHLLARGSKGASRTRLTGVRHMRTECVDTRCLAALASVVFLAEEHHLGQCLPDILACQMWDREWQSQPGSLVQVRADSSYASNDHKTLPKTLK